MSKQKINEYIEKIYTLRELKRYNNSSRIKDESVAEHTAFVALIVLKLHEFYDFDLGIALSMAISHDLSEIYITDIPYNVKQSYPLLKQTIQDIEYEVIRKNFSKNIFNCFLDFSKQQTNEAKIVNLADKLSVLQFTQTEVSLGNSGKIKDIYIETKKQLNSLYNSVKNIRRKTCQ